MDILLAEMSLENFTASIERLFKPVANNKGLEFDVVIDQNMPATLYTDWSKVEQIIRNFLSNALKFTIQGSIGVRIHNSSEASAFFQPDLNSGNTMAITVWDTGIGIPKHKQEQIFEAFRQADGTTSRKYGGTGLGLSISRKFADLLGAEIQVESQEGKGATFTLYLPLVFPKSKEVKANTGLILDKGADEATAVDFYDSSRIVLVVDDDNRNIFAMKQVLQPYVGKVLVANNGLEAIEMLTKYGGDIDVVLMDIMMPLMNGFEAMQAIRQQSRFSKLPILALTAKVMPGDREKCMEAGASDYIAKPVDGQQLLTTLSDWLGKPKLVDGAVEKRERKTAKPVEVVKTSEDMLVDDGLISLSFGDHPTTVLLVDDDMRNTFSLTQFLQKKSARVIMAQDGVKALAQLEKHSDVSIIIMDVMMPNMDGLETTKKFGENPQFKHLPIVALTAMVNPDDREKCLDSGMNDYLSKPVDLKLLITTMHELLKTSREARNKAAHNVEAE